MPIARAGVHSHELHSQNATQLGISRRRPGMELTPEEERKIQDLKKRDAEVRRHEQAHKTAAGPHSQGAPRYEYETGPDGKQYAVGGEVQIDTSEVSNDPEATIRKAQTIKRAALAPKDPSSQDRRVAAQASRMEFEAKQELAKQKQQEARLYNRDGRGTGQPTHLSTLDILF